MDYTFLDKFDFNAYVIDEQLKLLHINKYAAKRYKNPEQLLGRSILNCHKEESSCMKIIKMRDEFIHGRTEPYSYSLKKGEKQIQKVIFPYYENNNFRGMLEFSYCSNEE